MRIELSDDRKRLLFSSAAAAAIHLIILLIIGMRAADFSYEPEYGPVTVQISLEKPEPEPPVPEPVESFVAEDVPESDLVEQAPVERPAEPLPAAETVAVQPAAEKDAEVPEIDQSLIEAVKSRSRGSSDGLDARSVFGDDPVPASTDESVTEAASFFNDDGSEVVLSEAPSADRSPTAEAADDEDSVTLVDRDLMSSLDSRLSTVAVREDELSRDDGTEERAEAGSGISDGNAPVVSFRDASSSRELLEWTPPVIPEAVQKAGVARYTVIIEFDIDSDGVTSGAHLVKTSGDTTIDAAVQSALRNWIFEESSDDIKKVRAILTYVIEIK